MSAPWLRNNAASATSGAASVWSEHVANDNRTYYWNSDTKTSSWEKPDVLKTAEERNGGLANASGSTPDKAEDWKEYETPDGKKYYHNQITNITTWDKPEVMLAAEAQSKVEENGGRARMNGATAEDGDLEDELQQELERTDRINVVGTDGKAISAAMYALSDAAIPVFKTTEQAEDAFHKMLRKVGVQPDWSWDQTIRAAIKDPVWRALPDTVARKAAYEQYLIDVKKATIGKQKDRIEKLRRDFDQMLRHHDEIKSYSLWKNVKGNLEGEVAYKAAIDDEEREALFDTYVEQLAEREIQESKQKRKSAMDTFTELLKSLQIDLGSRWDDAQKAFSENETFKNNQKLRNLQKVDTLLAYEDYIRDLERDRSAIAKKEKAVKLREERKNREAFARLLLQMRSDGTIDAGVRWKDVYPSMKEDSAYLAILGQPGSSPLDLFWDQVDELDQELRNRKSMVLDVLDAKREAVYVDTEFASFVAVMQSDNRTSHMSEKTMRIIFKQLMDKALRKVEEEKKVEDRRIRRKQDDLRSAMKKLDPPIGVSDTYEAVRARISMLAEYTALENEESRIVAFTKYIKRLKERIEDEEERSSRRDRHSHRRGSSRERRHERERRSSRDSRRSGGGGGGAGGSDERDGHDSRRRRADTRGEAEARSPKRARKDSHSRPNGETGTAPEESSMPDHSSGSIVGRASGTAAEEDTHMVTANGTNGGEEGRMKEGDGDNSSEEGEIAE